MAAGVDIAALSAASGELLTSSSVLAGVPIAPVTALSGELTSLSSSKPSSKPWLILGAASMGGMLGAASTGGVLGAASTGGVLGVVAAVAAVVVAGAGAGAGAGADPTSVDAGEPAPPARAAGMGGGIELVVERERGGGRPGLGATAFAVGPLDVAPAVLAAVASPATVAAAVGADAGAVDPGTAAGRIDGVGLAVVGDAVEVGAVLAGVAADSAVVEAGAVLEAVVVADGDVVDPPSTTAATGPDFLPTLALGLSMARENAFIVGPVALPALLVSEVGDRRDVLPVELGPEVVDGAAGMAGVAGGRGSIGEGPAPGSVMVLDTCAGSLPEGGALVGGFLRSVIALLRWQERER